MKHRRKSAKHLFFPFFANSFHNLTKPKPIFIQTPLPSISVCMIVRNEEHCLAQCLESVRDLASEIILVDTGSTDRTIEIAQKFGAKVIQTSWNDHYAEARNLGLAEAMGDWVMILDADEVVSPEAKHLLPAYLRHYQGQDVVLNWRVCSSQHPDLYSRGLFLNHRGIEFAGRVHEVPVLPGKELSSYHCQDLVLWHESQGDQEAKLKYYQQLLKQNLVEETEAARMNHVQKHLGLNHLALTEWEAAWDVLSACYQGMQTLGIRPQDGFYGEVLKGLVQVGLQLGHPETRRYFQELQQYYPLEQMARDFGVSARQSHWRKGMVAVTMGLLAACQPAATVSGPSSSQHNQQAPILLNPENLIQPSADPELADYHSKLGDFRIKEAYWCPPQPSDVLACYQAGGTPFTGTTGTDINGNVCYHYGGCSVPTPTPTPPPTPTPGPTATPSRNPNKGNAKITGYSVLDDDDSSSLSSSMLSFDAIPPSNSFTVQANGSSPGQINKKNPRYITAVPEAVYHVECTVKADPGGEAFVDIKAPNNYVYHLGKFPFSPKTAAIGNFDWKLPSNVILGAYTAYLSLDAQYPSGLVVDEVSFTIRGPRSVLMTASAVDHINNNRLVPLPGTYFSATVYDLKGNPALSRDCQTLLNGACLLTDMPLAGTYYEFDYGVVKSTSPRYVPNKVSDKYTMNLKIDAKIKRYNWTAIPGLVLPVYLP